MIDVVTSEMQFELQRIVLVTRDQLIILNVIATNQWKRPIYFTSHTGWHGSNYFSEKRRTYFPSYTCKSNI